MHMAHMHTWSSECHGRSVICADVLSHAQGGLGHDAAGAPPAAGNGVCCAQHTTPGVPGHRAAGMVV